MSQVRNVRNAEDVGGVGSRAASGLADGVVPEVDEKPEEMGAGWRCVGEQLKAARVARKMSLADVSQAIKISPKVLEQVEGNAWQEMVGRTFARGVVRSYAMAMKIDPAPLLKALEAAPLPELPTLDLMPTTHTALPVTGQNRRDKLTVVTGVLFVLFAIAVYLFFPDGWLERGVNSLSLPSAPVVQNTVKSDPVVSVAPEIADVVTETPSVDVVEELPEVSVDKKQSVTDVVSAPVVAAPVVDSSSVAPTSSGSATKPVVSSSPPASSAALAFHFNETSWLEVRDRNDVLLFSDNVESGDARYINGDAPFYITLGNAHGVELVYRGEPVDLKPHTKQNVARVTLE